MRALLIWLGCRAAYAVYMHLPWSVAKRANFLLPHAGAYAYSDTWDDFLKTSYFKARKGE